MVRTVSWGRHNRAVTWQLSLHHPWRCSYSSRNRVEGQHEPGQKPARMSSGREDAPQLPALIPLPAANLGPPLLPKALMHKGHQCDQGLGVARTEAGGLVQALCPLGVRGAPRDSLVPGCMGHRKHIWVFFVTPWAGLGSSVGEKGASSYMAFLHGYSIWFSSSKTSYMIFVHT